MEVPSTSSVCDSVGYAPGGTNEFVRCLVARPRRHRLFHKEQIKARHSFRTVVQLAASKKKKKKKKKW
jgi:hypothetical protein